MNALDLERRFRRAPALVPSGPKAKDFLFKAPPPITLAPSINVLPYTRLRDQLSIGSCVGNSICFAAESIRNRFRAIDADSDCSRELAYTLAKFKSGLLGQGDTGASIRGGLDAAVQYGLAPERLVPYDLAGWDVMPPQATLDLAAPHRVSLYERLTINPDNYRDTINAVKTAMNMGLRVIAGIWVPRGMFGISGPMSGHAAQWSWTDPALSTVVGAHAIMLAGYDDALFPSGLGSVLMANSWGPAWGDAGVSATPWLVLTNFVFELGAIHDFDGYREGAVVDPATQPLPQERKRELWAALDSLGLPLVAQNYCPAYEFLRRQGCSDLQIADLAGVAQADLQGFKSGNAGRLAAWAGF